MNDLFNFFTDDWKKIPQNYRYIILAGIFLIFNSWLLDHWGLSEPYTLFGIDVRQNGYSMGLLLIIIAFLIIIIKQFFSFGKVIWYRSKYPIEKLDSAFYLVWFNGKLMLFDTKSNPKKYYHVLPWETAQDLLFVSRGFQVNTPFTPNALGKFPANNEGEMLVMKDFSNGGIISTQSSK